MKSTTVSVFETTCTKTNNWLREILSELDWDDHEKAYKALRIVLHTLRDQLPTKEITDLSAQLPMFVRGMYFEGWNPNHKSERLRTAEKFVAEVNSHFPEFDCTESEYVDAQEITRAVLAVLSDHISRGEIEDVIACLPSGLKELWN